VHRRFSGLIVEGDAPTRGTKVMAGDKEIGEITSSAQMVVDGVQRTVALGYVRREAAAKTEHQDESLYAGGSVAKITALPIQF
jgi:glycine cleavage system aminomethyltransferase T